MPDHRRVVPYRFIVFAGEARGRAGSILSTMYGNQNPGADAASLALEQQRFLRAPVVVAVVAKTDPAHKTPEWEQVLCCGAVCHNMLLGASASGFAGQWLTEWYAYDREVLAAFGLAQEERIAGFIYLGTAKEDPLERPRVEAADITTHWQGG
ncbi:nitroreductase [Aquisalinus flavus]|uniref:Nitroreductase n=1 Tax=Aquisalinus flavus TaxID=1526572 RepID=A0A8J2V128_9PROT|nr:nitroreductase [Aquisalinus flavus]